MNYKFSFRVKPVNKATELPNMNTLSKEFQQYLVYFSLINQSLKSLSSLEFLEANLA